MSCCRFFLSVLLALWITGATPAMAAEWNIDTLMQTLAQVTGSQANFSEIKTLALLDQPVMSSGVLFYKAPDYFEQRTLLPKSETLILNGDTVLIIHDEHRYQLKLADYPDVAAFTESIRGTLAGDLKSLQRSYALSLEGSRTHWKLLLLPTDNRIKGHIARILIEGDNNELRSIQIDQTDGDSSIMTISHPTLP